MVKARRIRADDFKDISEKRMNEREGERRILELLIWVREYMVVPGEGMTTSMSYH